MPSENLVLQAACEAVDTQLLFIVLDGPLRGTVADVCRMSAYELIKTFLKLGNR